MAKLCALEINHEVKHSNFSHHFLNLKFSRFSLFVLIATREKHMSQILYLKVIVLRTVEHLWKEMTLS